MQAITHGENASVHHAPDANAREAMLTALVDRWTEHMRWRKNFDRWREDRLWQEDGQMPRIRMIEREHGPNGGERVLDIGSGMGGFLVAAARNAMNVVGLEPNADYCTITRLRGARYGLTPSVVRSVGETLPFSDHSFDVVLAQDILEHVRDPDSTLREMRRVVCPGGLALVTVINRFAWRDPHYHLRGINWLPRPLGEAIVERIGRSKRGARFTDNQRLTEMYYDTFGGFAARVAGMGFVATDMKESLLMQPTATGAKNARHAALKRALRRCGLLRAAYRLHRCAVVSTFEVALRPVDVAR
ncbi:MAG TPA: methyltransferase domain-containing protein [Thermomicrobiales bacterium]